MKLLDYLPEPAKAAPTIGVGGLTFFGVQFADWIMVGTFIYTVFLIIDKFPIVVQRLSGLVRWVRQKARRNDQGN